MPTDQMVRELGLGNVNPTQENCKRCGTPVERYGRYTFNLATNQKNPLTLHALVCGESGEEELGGPLPPIPAQTESEFDENGSD